jgi:hypothetical protein
MPAALTEPSSRPTLARHTALALATLALAARADAFVYWANDEANTIGRANLDGSGVEQSFISGLSGSLQSGDTSDKSFSVTFSQKGVHGALCP